MPIGNITQTISTIPPAGARGVDVQTIFVTKQEDFQDHLQGTTVTELNALVEQLNSRIGEINSTTTTMGGYADTASASASTATTKAGEASASASEALTSRNQAETFKNNASASATKASQWADNNYNAEVETDKYSAKHWATVAENAVGDTVKLTGNQTVTGVKTFSSNIVGSITGNSETATKLATSRTINGVSFDGSANITVSDSTAVKLTGNETIAGVKTFSSPIIGSFIGTVVFSDSAGNDFTNSNIEIRGNGSTIKPAIGFHQPSAYAGTLTQLDEHTFQFIQQDGYPATLIVPTPTTDTQAANKGYVDSLTGGAWSANDTRAKTTLNASGTAPIYACRAWVNFNGTGTVAIRASGNVSSITDNGSGDYTVNFINAMPDANYSLSGTAAFFITGVPAAILIEASDGISGTILKTISALRLYTVNNNDDNIADAGSINISIFR